MNIKSTFMKSILLNLLAIAIVMSAGVSMAQYPNMTEEEMKSLEGYNALVPEPTFEDNPTPCAPDDTTGCKDPYLEVYGEHFQGYMTAQQHPSPIYSWNSSECILNTDQCGTLQTQWETWVNKANTGGLDFSQGTNPATPPECIEVEGAWFGLEPAYKCYQSK
jgi:hypothetical protein